MPVARLIPPALQGPVTGPISTARLIPNALPIPAAPDLAELERLQLSELAPHRLPLQQQRRRSRVSRDRVVRLLVARRQLDVALAIERWVRPRGAVDAVYASGGGCQNPALMRSLADRLAPVPLKRIERLGVASESKEALAFAFLAHQSLCGQAGNVPGATGAQHAAVLGHVTPGALASGARA